MGTIYRNGQYYSGSGFSPSITVENEDNTNYQLRIIDKHGTVITPNLKPDRVNSAKKLEISNSGTLIAGESVVTIIDSRFTETMSYSFFSDKYGISINSVVYDSNSVIIDISPEPVDVHIKVAGQEL